MTVPGFTPVSGVRRVSCGSNRGWARSMGYAITATAERDPFVMDAVLVHGSIVT